MKLRIFKYPEQTKEEIESICSSSNKSLFDDNEKEKLKDIEARYCGHFMIEVQKITSQLDL